MHTYSTCANCGNPKGSNLKFCDACLAVMQNAHAHTRSQALNSGGTVTKDSGSIEQEQKSGLSIFLIVAVFFIPGLSALYFFVNSLNPPNFTLLLSTILFFAVIGISAVGFIYCWGCLFLRDTFWTVLSTFVPIFLPYLITKNSSYTKTWWWLAFGLLGPLTAYLLLVFIAKTDYIGNFLYRVLEIIYLDRIWYQL